MIKVNNLSVLYGERKVLNNISIDIETNKITTIIGPNGCGKSTLIKAISGIFENANNQIEIFGKKRARYSRKEFAKKVSFLMQFSDAPQGMNVYDLVSFGRLPYKNALKSLKKEDYEIIDWAMSKTKIIDLKDALVSTLSGGERQRVFLAMALAQKTDIIILDEPTNHLDMKHQYELLSLIKELNDNEQLTIICVLHDINQAIRYSDEVIIMKNGSIIAKGTPKQCITKEMMHFVYDVNCVVNKIGSYPQVSVI